MQAREVFVFAGAGASYCRPAALPMFLAMRDEILRQLELDRYIPTWDPNADAATAKYRQVAAGLNPEPFMLALKRACLEVGPWLAATLRTGSPNAVHYALARLAGAGAAVWTVNFDTKIEDASAGMLRVSAFPDPPAADAQLLKPHGTLDGDLILDSEQVLRPLQPEWEQRLHADVQGRTVVFLGYSAKDRDFQPVWDRVLAGCREVLWFDLPDPKDEHRRRAILRGVDAEGRLAFPPPLVRTSGGRPNPSADFVRWCQDQGLVDVAADLVAELRRRSTERSAAVTAGTNPSSLNRTSTSERQLLQISLYRLSRSSSRGERSRSSSRTGSALARSVRSS